MDQITSSPTESLCEAYQRLRGMPPATTREDRRARRRGKVRLALGLGDKITLNGMDCIYDGDGYVLVSLMPVETEV